MNSNSSLPHNLDAEKAILGSIIIRPSLLFEIVDILSPDCFYSLKNKAIFEAILELSTKHEPIDVLTVSNFLKKKGSFDSIGNDYFAELMNSSSVSVNIVHYAMIVFEKYLLRKLIEASQYISTQALEEKKSIEEILNEAEKKIFDITIAPKNKKVFPLKDVLMEAWERIERLHESKDKLRGIPTGFPKLDDLLSGLQKQDLIIIAARPSMGKTTLALDIARKTAVNYKTPTLIFSLEMNSQQLVDRMLAAESFINTWKLRTGKINLENDFMKLRDSLDRLAKAPIFIDDKPANNIINMRSVARKTKVEHGLGLIIVDYLQLMSVTRNYDSMTMQVTEISRSLKALARELDVPVVALSQLSRAIETRGGRPRLSDLRDSGSIEQDADVVMFIHREDKYKDEEEKTNIAEILVEKHRNGPTGKIDLYFDEQHTTFLPLEENLNVDLEKELLEETEEF